jgi:hypothetical protein
MGLFGVLGTSLSDVRAPVEIGLSADLPVVVKLTRQFWKGTKRYV